MLDYYQLDSWEHISVKFEKEIYHFHSRKFIQKCRLPTAAAILYRGEGGGGGGGGGWVGGGW